MSKNNNILDPHDQNHELLIRLWDGLKRKGDGKCYCPCSQCWGFKRRKINITTAKRHCREDGHAEEGHDYRPFVSFYYICIYIDWFVNVCIILIFFIVYIREVCDKFSNSNISHSNEENRQLLARLCDVAK